MTALLGYGIIITFTDNVTKEFHSITCDDPEPKEDILYHIISVFRESTETTSKCKPVAISHGESFSAFIFRICHPLGDVLISGIAYFGGKNEN